MQSVFVFRKEEADSVLLIDREHPESASSEFTILDFAQLFSSGRDAIAPEI